MRDRLLCVVGMITAISIVTYAELAYAVEYWPSSTAWAKPTPAQAGMDPTRLADAIKCGKDRGGSGLVVRGGRAIGQWGDQTVKYDLKSSTKSFGSIVLGLAIKDQLVDLDTHLMPALTAELATQEPLEDATVWAPQLTVRHLATHTGGFEKTGGFGAWQFAPGTRWFYSDGGPNWLADLLTVSYMSDLRTVLRSRVLTPMGIGSDRLVWRSNAYRPTTLHGIARREFGSGISTSVDVMARLGLMLLRDGRWKATQILPETYADLAGAHQAWLAGVGCVDPDPKKCPGANQRYGLLFWNNADGSFPDVPTDAYWSAGLGTSFVLVIPSLDLVAARAGKEWPSTGPADRVMGPFFAKLAQAVVP
jgi:CubicO group peptidase (beta-lactamase class C family)